MDCSTCPGEYGLLEVRCQHLILKSILETECRSWNREPANPSSNRTSWFLDWFCGLCRAVDANLPLNGALTSLRFLLAKWDAHSWRFLQLVHVFVVSTSSRRSFDDTEATLALLLHRTSCDSIHTICPLNLALQGFVQCLPRGFGSDGRCSCGLLSHSQCISPLTCPL